MALISLLGFGVPAFAATDEAKPEIKNLSNVSDTSTKVFMRAEFNKSSNARKYTLGPNDIINVTVLGSKELTQEGVRVQPDGKISLVYLSDLNVTGMTIDELQNVIRSKYSEYLVKPEISVVLTQSRPFIVYVSGAVYNPGTYELNTITNATPYYSSKTEAFVERKTPLLSNIIVAAGGLSYDADLEHVQIQNSAEGSKFEVNLLDLIKNANSEQDIYLIAGDKIIVPRLPSPLAVDNDNYKLLAKSTLFQTQIPVRIIGYVSNPGLIKLDASTSSNLNSAIAAAGGYAGGAPYSPDKVYISRIDNNSKLITKAVDPNKTDIALMPNDVVYVPDKVRPIIGRGFDYLLRIVAPFSAASSTYYNWDTVRRR